MLPIGRLKLLPTVLFHGPGAEEELKRSSKQMSFSLCKSIPCHKLAP